MFATVILLFVTTESSAQQFKYKMSLGTVDSTFFYRIVLSPEVIAKSNATLSDIRVLDEEGKEQPYIIKAAAPVFKEASFIEFPIISKEREADKQAHVVVKNTQTSVINHLLLFIKNTEAKRNVTISGSEDQTKWYVIKENIALDNYYQEGNGESFIQSVAFPSIHYQYFKITILGKDILPVDILKAGIYNETKLPGTYNELPTPAMNPRDSSDKKSYIHLSFNDTYLVDKLDLSVDGAKFYKRAISIYPGSLNNSTAINYTLSSNEEASFPVGFKVKELWLVIDNEDNPPLKITNISAGQLNKYLLCHLEKGKSYSLVFGDSTAKIPNYDLQFFKDSIPRNVLEITPVRLETYMHTDAAKKNIFNSPAFLWSVIAVVLAFLLYASYKLMRDVESKKAKDKNA